MGSGVVVGSVLSAGVQDVASRKIAETKNKMEVFFMVYPDNKTGGLKFGSIIRAGVIHLYFSP